MSAKINDFIIISTGINTKFAPFNAATLDINVDLADLVDKFAKEIEKNLFWKEIFSKYMIEFKNQKITAFTTMVRKCLWIVFCSVMMVRFYFKTKGYIV